MKICVTSYFFGNYRSELCQTVLDKVKLPKDIPFFLYTDQANLKSTSCVTVVLYPSRWR